MTVRRLKSKQLGPRCSFCSQRAVWRGCGFTKFACAYHADDLERLDRRSNAPDNEADWYAGLR